MHGLVGGLTKKAAFQKAGYSASALSNPDSVLNRPAFVLRCIVRRVRYYVPVVCLENG